MLHDPDRVSLQDVRNNIDKAGQAWRGCKRFGQQGVNSGIETGAAARPGRSFLTVKMVSSPPWLRTISCTADPESSSRPERGTTFRVWLSARPPETCP
jgi:hypothetical protein